MNKRALLGYVVAACFLLLTACSKDEATEPYKTIEDKGAVAGSAYPIIGALKVTAKSVTDSTQVYSGGLDEAGRFELSGLPVGKYTVRIVPSAGFEAPDPMLNVPVYKNVVNQLGKFEMHRSASLKYVANGVSYSGDNRKVNTYRNGAYLYLTSGIIYQDQADHKVEIYLPNYQGPGTYTMDDAGVNIAYIYRNEARWKSQSGTVKIIEYDQTNHLLEGTFSFDAIPANTEATGNVQVTNGTFYDVYLPE